MLAILIGIVLLLVFELWQIRKKRKFNDTMYAIKRNTNKMLSNIHNGNGNFHDKLKSRYL